MNLFSLARLHFMLEIFLHNIFRILLQSHCLVDISLQIKNYVTNIDKDSRDF